MDSEHNLVQSMVQSMHNLQIFILALLLVSFVLLSS